MVPALDVKGTSVFEGGKYRGYLGSNLPITRELGSCDHFNVRSRSRSYFYIRIGIGDLISLNDRYRSSPQKCDP